jgi:hypothetical protein
MSAESSAQAQEILSVFRRDLTPEMAMAFARHDRTSIASALDVAENRASVERVALALEASEFLAIYGENGVGRNHLRQKDIFSYSFTPSGSEAPVIAIAGGDKSIGPFETLKMVAPYRARLISVASHVIAADTGVVGVIRGLRTKGHDSLIGTKDRLMDDFDTSVDNRSRRIRCACQGNLYPQLEAYPILEEGQEVLLDVAAFAPEQQTLYCAVSALMEKL